MSQGNASGHQESIESYAILQAEFGLTQPEHSLCKVESSHIHKGIMNSAL